MAYPGKAVRMPKIGMQKELRKTAGRDRRRTTMDESGRLAISAFSDVIVRCDTHLLSFGIRKSGVYWRFGVLGACHKHVDG